jgi:hypothetical protein
MEPAWPSVDVISDNEQHWVVSYLTTPHPVTGLAWIAMPPSDIEVPEMRPPGFVR